MSAHRSSTTRSMKNVTNQASKILSKKENDRLFEIIGPRAVTLSSAVVQVYLALQSNGNRWSHRCCGVAAFIRDNSKRSYYIRVIDLKFASTIWEQEIYNQFKYKTPREYFHTFDTDECQAGLNFANEEEAKHFKNAVQDKLNQRQQKRLERKRTEKAGSGHLNKADNVPSAPGISAPALPYVSDGRATVQDNKGKKDKKKKILTKEDIGAPTNFRHVGHVGWDPEKGFDMDNLDPTLKDLFDEAGISSQQLQDKETANFIYQFIDQRGGIDAIRKEQSMAPSSRRGALPPVPPAASAGRGGMSAPPPPPPSRHGSSAASMPPPQPPPSSRSAMSSAPPPPPPSSGRPRIRGAAQPPPHSGMSAPPPPPPPSRGAGPPQVTPPPPPPPVAAGGGAAPPPPPPPPPAAPPLPAPGADTSAPQGGAGGARGNLLAEIRGGASLKHVDPDQASGGAPTDARSNLLEQIRGGAALKHIDDATLERQKADAAAPGGGIASALAQALANRAVHMQADDDSDSEDMDSDDDEDEWD